MMLCNKMEDKNKVCKGGWAGGGERENSDQDPYQKKCEESKIQDPRYKIFTKIRNQYFNERMVKFFYILKITKVSAINSDKKENISNLFL